MVKAFNSLSAWSLQNGPSDASRQVLEICFFSPHSLSQSYLVGTMNLGAAQIFNLVLRHASFWNQYIQFHLSISSFFSDVFTLRVADQQVENNSLSQKGILRFAPNHIIKPF